MVMKEREHLKKKNLFQDNMFVLQGKFFFSKPILSAMQGIYWTCILNSHHQSDMSHNNMHTHTLHNKINKY